MQGEVSCIVYSIERSQIFEAKMGRERSLAAKAKNLYRLPLSADLINGLLISNSVPRIAVKLT